MAKSKYSILETTIDERTRFHNFILKLKRANGIHVNKFLSDVNYDDLEDFFTRQKCGNWNIMTAISFMDSGSNPLTRNKAPSLFKEALSFLPASLANDLEYFEREAGSNIKGQITSLSGGPMAKIVKPYVDKLRLEQIPKTPFGQFILKLKEANDIYVNAFLSDINYDDLEDFFTRKKCGNWNIMTAISFMDSGSDSLTRNKAPSLFKEALSFLPTSLANNLEYFEREAGSNVPERITSLSGGPMKKIVKPYVDRLRSESSITPHNYSRYGAIGYTPSVILNPSQETGKALQEKNSQINP